MAQIVQLSNFSKSVRGNTLATQATSDEAIATLTRALTEFSAAIHTFGTCLRSNPDTMEQARMMDAWEVVRSGLYSLTDPMS